MSDLWVVYKLYVTGNIPCFSLELGFTGSKPLSWSPFHVMTEPPNWYAKSRRTRTASQQGDDGWKLVSSTSMVPPWRRCLKRWKNGENFGKCKPGWWLIVINHNSDLVGGIGIPLWKNMKANGKDDIPYTMENNKCMKPPTSKQCPC